MTRPLSKLRRDDKFLLHPQDAIEYRMLWPNDRGITVADHAGRWVNMPADTEVYPL